MVNTRSSASKEQKKEYGESSTSQPPSQPPTSKKIATIEKNMPSIEETKVKTLDKTRILPESSIKSEQRPQQPRLPTSIKSKTSNSKKSSSSSMQARIARLELQAAEEKARIQMELIDKRLATNIAEIEEEMSEHQNYPTSANSEVEKWLERSQHEPEQAQSTHDHGVKKGQLCQPAASCPGTSNGTVQMLASALKDLAATSANTISNANLLSRISTPRDLPIFSGDPMEWLQFKHAYEESTQLCNFSSKENLWRIRKCLRGPAKDAVSALLISATEPEKILATLELRFGNPDSIIMKIMQDIKKLHPMSQDYQKDIVVFSVKIQNFMEAVRSVKRDEYLQGMYIVSLILSKLPTVLISKWSDYSFPLITEGKKSRLDILADFLKDEAVKISTTANIHILNTHTNYNKEKYPIRAHDAVLVTTDNNYGKCLYCRLSKHKLTECKRFKKSLRKERWRHVKRHGICYKCLESRHDRETCPAAACDVDSCGQSHHRLLHFTLDSRQPENNVHITEITENETVTNINLAPCKVLLKTVPIDIHGPNGVVSATALLDDGSTVSLISHELAKQIGLHGYKQTIQVSGAWNNSALECDSETVDFRVSNKDGTMFTIRARSVKDLNLPAHDATTIDILKYERFVPNIMKYIPTKRCKPQILIGQDNYNLLLPLQTITDKTNGLYITRTALGVCIHGCVRDPLQRVRAPLHSQTLHSALLIDNNVSMECMECEHKVQVLEEQIRLSFAIESMGVLVKGRQNVEEVRAISHLEKTAVLKDGRWHVGLPWKDTNCKMLNSYSHALSRLKGVERRMKADTGYAARYSERINHLIDNGFTRKLTCEEYAPRTWYLPHFGVDNPNKNKMRLVFDAASKASGHCLNDYLLKGPDLLVSLFGIMLRFRENPVAITGDIRDMFLRIKILPEDQEALRFLWRDVQDEKSTVSTYAMTSLIFGANCSPFIAQFIKNKNAQQYESFSSSAVDAIHKQHYMDDYIDSIGTESMAIKMVQDIIYIHKQGGFEIRNFTSNSRAVLNNVPKEALGPSAVRFKVGLQSQGERTLGLIWYPDKDMLAFDVSFKKIPIKIISGETRPSKRQMLKVLMSIFDVFGFLSPFTIKGKIILQDVWRLQLGWDDDIPDIIYQKWIEWLSLLRVIDQLRIPRYYKAAAGQSETEYDLSSHSARANAPIHTTVQPASSEGSRAVYGCAGFLSHYINLQLHTFCDASTKAMCAVAYWRWTENGQYYVAFVASKCRVAPVKYLSVPRLELTAALLAGRLADTIIREHKIRVCQRYFWCDSTVVLHWIRNNMRNYKTFVAHRLGEIDELTRQNEWGHVPTRFNVADIATKENCDLSLLKNEWFRGPPFLYEDECKWPFGKHLPGSCELPDIPGEDLEYVMVMRDTKACLPPIPDPTRFSSWLRLMKATCNVLLFIDKCKKLKSEVDGNMMTKAELLLVKYSQLQTFHKELAYLKNNIGVDKKSRLLTLSPFLDQHGILRVGGRISAAAEIPLHVKQPIILDGRNHIARLITRYYHLKAAHGFNETVVNELRQKYWILRIRPTVRSVASQCMFCRIRKAQPHTPRMGDLPSARMAHRCRPFTHCGMDLFGPMDITVIRRHERRYGVLFTCLTIRAVHIELVPSLTTDSLIMALRRMAARRGWPQFIYSDNGTNLRGANNELKRSVLELDQNALKAEAVNYGTTWTFIPAGSPHWGGAWERLIRSVKQCLKIVLKERSPREETLITLLAEVEQMVNSRPLTHVSVEPNTQEALTPNHFLLGTSSHLPVLGEFDNSDLQNMRKQWRLTQRLADMFWRRWVKEVLPTMLPRQKWQREAEPLQVGDLVVIADPDAPRNAWPKGIIERVLPGKDGRVRLVEVRNSKNGIIQRSATRVARIPMDVEC